MDKVISVGALIMGSLYLLYKQHKQNKLSKALAHAPSIDTSQMRDIEQLLFDDDDEEYQALLASLYNFAVDMVPQLVQSGAVSSKAVGDRLTLYSLYKQVEIGDAASQQGVTRDAKYRAWLGQKGKPRQQCQEEYVCVVARYSEELSKLLEEIEEGERREFVYERKSGLMDRINSTSGGALAKSVSVPSKALSQEEKNFMNSMNNREKELMTIYEGLRKQGTAAGPQLLEMVVKGDLKPQERDKLGLCPFLFAIDASLDLQVIQQLVTKGGCDIRSRDHEGDTALHYAVNLENEELQQWLLEVVGEEFKECRNGCGLRPYDEE